MLLTPSEYYAQSEKSDRFIRRVSGPFEDGLAKGERKALRRLDESGLTVMESNVDECYPIILDNRERKGRPYSMSLNDWKVLATEPDSVHCFMAGDIAAAMCVRVSPETLYVQAWGDRETKKSPVVLLCKGIYNWCSENSFDVLDIGIAGDNAGLADFKRRLGFRLP